MLLLQSEIRGYRNELKSMFIFPSFNYHYKSVSHQTHKMTKSLKIRQTQIAAKQFHM